MPYKPGDLYQPSNGTDGSMFEDEFCANCKRDEAFFKTEGVLPGCEIHAHALAFDLKDAEYPKEWTYTEGGAPTCTAFTDIELPKGWDTSNNLNLF